MMILIIVYLLWRFVRINRGNGNCPHMSIVIKQKYTGLLTKNTGDLYHDACINPPAHL